MINSSKYINDTSLSYALYVASTRALPSITDGLKDGQRKALWLMRNKGDKIKTVSLSGEMIQSNLYVHGDMSASDTIGKLAAPYLNNIPLLEGIGNFGTKITPGEIGAARYTYVKKPKYANNLVYNDLDLIELKENYDGSNLEPISFLPLLPLVLLNGISGIAVGWKTDILPRSKKDLQKAVEAVLSNKKIPKLKPHFSSLHEDVKIAWTYKQLGYDGKSDSLIKQFRNYINHDKSIYKGLMMTEYYTYKGEYNLSS